MKETEYAFAVARIRYNELTLLNSTELDQLITSADYKEVMARLSDKGWFIPSDIYNYGEMLQKEIMKAWELLCEIAPDIHELDMLIVKNDFHNLKAALKCIVNKDNNAINYVINPSISNPEEIIDAVDKHNFDVLPEYLVNSAKEAYDAIIRLNNGQLADVAIDRATIETMVSMARSTKKQLLVQIAEIICNTANIKNAYRCIQTGKDKDYMELSLADINAGLDKKRIIECCEKGSEELTEYLKHTDFSGAANAYEEGSTAFEKWCDDAVMMKIADAKSRAFGIEPLVAYFIAKEAEIKNVRIILSAKRNNLDADIIRKRVRALYV